MTNKKKYTENLKHKDDRNNVAYYKKKSNESILVLEMKSKPETTNTGTNESTVTAY